MKNLTVHLLISLSLVLPSWARANTLEVTLKDKLEGMFLLGAFGDHTGFFVEGTNSEQRHVSPTLLEPSKIPSMNPFNVSVDVYEWGKWFEDSVVSDDTSYLHKILVPYGKWLQENNVRANDVNFGRYLVESDRQIQDGSHSFYFKKDFAAQRENYHRQLLDWIMMLNEALCGRDSNYCFLTRESRDAYKPSIPNGELIGFYSKDLPICFGLFMFMPLARTQIQNSPIEAYHFFRGLTELDQVYAPVATGILGSLIAQALKVEASKIDFRSWFTRKFNRLVELIPDEDIVELFPRDYIAATSFNHFYPQGGSLADRTRQMVMIGVRESGIEYCRAKLPKEAALGTKDVRPMGFDPAEFLCTMNMIARYSPVDPSSEYSIERAHRFIVSTGGDTDTIGSIFGLLEGAFYGRSGISRNVSLATRIYLDGLEKVLREHDQIDLSEAAQIILDLGVWN